MKPIDYAGWAVLVLNIYVAALGLWHGNMPTVALALGVAVLLAKGLRHE